MKTIGTFAVAFAATLFIGAVSVSADGTTAAGDEATAGVQDAGRSAAYVRWNEVLEKAADAAARTQIMQRIGRGDVDRLLDAAEAAVEDDAAEDVAHALLAEIVVNHPDAGIRLNAVEQLAELEDELFARLRDRGAAGMTGPERKRVLSIVSGLYQRALIAALAAALIDGDTAVRQEALLLLGEMDRDAYFPADILTDIGASDPSAELRMGALELLTAAGGEVAVIPLTHALSDPDPRVVTLAVDMLNQL